MRSDEVVIKISVHELFFLLKILGRSKECWDLPEINEMAGKLFMVAAKYAKERWEKSNGREALQ